MVWWREAVKVQLKIQLRGLALALAYAVLCWATRKVSLDQFYLPAGVRVAALLIFPVRMWPYLILGEYAYFAHLRLPMVETYGASWAVAASIVPMPVVALLVHWHQRLLVRSDAWLISLAALSAVSATMVGLCLSHLLWPIPHRNEFATDATRNMLGNFIGILTLAPIAMLRAKGLVARTWLILSGKRTLFALATIGSLAMLVQTSSEEYSNLRVSLQLCMFIPAAALTCMYGWRGAAVGIMSLNLAVGLTMPGPEPWSFNSDTFVVQQLLATASVALLMTGDRISHYYLRYTQNLRYQEASATHIRASQLFAEMHLRDCVGDMRRVGDRIDHSLSEVAHWLEEQGNHRLSRSIVKIAAANSHKFRDQTSLVYPAPIEHVGLYLSLQITGIAEEWKDTRRVLTPRLTGDPCPLRIGVQLAAYRTLIDAVGIIMKHEQGHVRVRARCFQLEGNHGIAISVELHDPIAALSTSTRSVAIELLTGRVLAYRGRVDCRANRIRILLLDQPSSDLAC